MEKIKVLNLYAGIGGNRKLWPDDEIEVTAVEINPQIAEIYKQNFPQDHVIVGDAHKYLIDHHFEYDFIWSSRPCQSHSRVNAAFNAHGKGIYKYPDMKLYEEIIFLKHFAKCKWVVENVVPYYKPLVEPSAIRGRHFFWSNFPILSKGSLNNSSEPIEYVKVTSGRYGFNICDHDLKGLRKTQILRNCVDPQLGFTIFKSAFKEQQITLTKKWEE